MINLKENEGLCTAIIQEIKIRLSANGCEAAVVSLSEVFRSSVARQRQIPSLTISMASVIQDAASVANLSSPDQSLAEAVLESALACDRLDRQTVRVLTFCLVEFYVRGGDTERTIEAIERLEWPEFRLQLARYFGKCLHDAGFHVAGEILLSLLPHEDSARERLDTYQYELDRGQYATALRTACFIPTKQGGLVSLLNSDSGRDALGWLAIAQALNRSSGQNSPRRIES